MSLPGLHALRCPHCAATLQQEGKRLSCAAGHSFDLAKHGYAPLVAAKSNLTTGDTAGQVAARERFLGSGAYEPFIPALHRACAVDAPGIYVEPGCGTAYYLAAVLESAPEREAIGIDTSKYALRRAARAHERMGAVLADAWQGLPLTNDSVAAVFNIFAPRNPEEIHRVLHPQGRLITLTPNPDHLQPLPELLRMLKSEEDKEQRLAESLGARFSLAGSEKVSYTLPLSTGDVANLLGMGPTARHYEEGRLEAEVQTSVPDSVKTTISVTIGSWQPH